MTRWVPVRRGNGGTAASRGAAVSFERCWMEMRNEDRKSASRTPVTDLSLSQPDCSKQMATRLLSTQVH